MAEGLSLMGSAQNDIEEPAHPRPVVVITDEMMAAWREEERLNPPPKDPNAYISPLGDLSVQGYPTDEHPFNNGIKNMVEVVKILEDASVPCCMIAEPALIYYGTGRVMTEWIMCVPTELLEKAANLFRAQSTVFEPFRPSALSRPCGLEHLYPRFKFVGLSVFFILMTSQAWDMPCKPENIEYSHNGIPYPKLPVYAQSLLDTWNGVDLDDLVDGMNLTPEWGEENLNLEGTVDTEWFRWREIVLYGEKARHDQTPSWCSNPMKRRDIWHDTASAEAKERRQGWKFLPINETRFRKRGQKDPRLRRREYC